LVVIDETVKLLIVITSLMLITGLDDVPVIEVFEPPVTV
jgi:hypothetical protein